MNTLPTRYFNLTYIILDSIFCIILLFLFIYKKRYITLFWSLFGGVLYFLVDFGYFYLISGSREVYINNILQNSLYTGLILLWMSLSYGITNFAFIWLCLKKDKYLKEWLMLIIGWWLLCPCFAKLGGEFNIKTIRTTNQYHYVMLIILIVGYLIFLLYSFIKKESFKKIVLNLLMLNIIGFSVQFCWEAALLLNGIRPLNVDSFNTLIIDSLIETNLGMPYIYFIYLFINKYRKDDLTKKHIN